MFLLYLYIQGEGVVEVKEEGREEEGNAHAPFPSQTWNKQPSRYSDNHPS